MAYFEAPPIPKSNPVPCIKLYTGIAKFNAVSPFVPSPYKKKKVSASI